MAIKDNRDGAPPEYSQPYNESDTAFTYPIQNPDWVRKLIVAPSHDGVPDYSVIKKPNPYKQFYLVGLLGLLMLMFQSPVTIGVALGVAHKWIILPTWRLLLPEIKEWRLARS